MANASSSEQGSKPLSWRRYRDQHALKTYASFYGPYKWQLLGAVVLFLIKYSPVFIIPIITADIINLITSNPPGDAHDILVKLLVGSVIILQNIPMHIWYVRTFSRVNRAVECDLRTALCARLQHLSMHFHHENKTGSLQTKILRDVENIEELTRMLVDNTPGVISSLVIAVVVTAMRAPIFLLFYLVLIPLARLIYVSIRRQMSQRNQDFRVSVETMNSYVTEMLRLIPVTRAHSLEATEMDRVKTRLEEIRSTGFKLDSLNAIFGSVNWSIIMCFNLLTLCLAGYLKLTGKLNIGAGDIVLLTGYFNTISSSVMGLLNFMPSMSKGLESVKSVGDILECPDLEQNEGKTAVTGVRGAFDFEHVDFRYAPDAEPAVRNFSLHVEPGETIALVGPSGAGKSTLVQMLVGFIRPTHGVIRLDGQDMNTLDLRTYRHFISVVTQETILFDGTIRDNIAYGIPNPAPALLEQAVRDADLDSFVAALPQGLDTPIHENGERLSGGQRQRLAIARALLRNPRVLILDEATSALDVDAEAEIKGALAHLMAGRTSFVVAHRLSTIQNATRIIVLEHGSIVEIGNHHDLMARNGRYAEMYHKFAMME